MADENSQKNLGAGQELLSLEEAIEFGFLTEIYYKPDESRDELIGFMKDGLNIRLDKNPAEGSYYINVRDGTRTIGPDEWKRDGRLRKLYYYALGVYHDNFVTERKLPISCRSARIAMIFKGT